MSDYHIALGSLAAVIGIVSYVPYFRDIFSGSTKPHPFSWLAWGLLVSVAFFAQIVKGGGAGAWASGVTALACFAIGALAFKRGEKDITRLDWFCFISSIVSIAFWQLANDPLIAVVIVTLADALAFVPTVRKAFLRPREETLLTYVLSIPKWGLGIIALQSFNLTTALFPASIFVMNVVFVAMIIIRRGQLGKA